jgi:hypothetical protein
VPESGSAFALISSHLQTAPSSSDMFSMAI